MYSKEDRERDYLALIPEKYHQNRPHQLCDIDILWKAINYLTNADYFIRADFPNEITKQFTEDSAKILDMLVRYADELNNYTIKQKEMNNETKET